MHKTMTIIIDFTGGRRARQTLVVHVLKNIYYYY